MDKKIFNNSSKCNKQKRRNNNKRLSRTTKEKSTIRNGKRNIKKSSSHIHKTIESKVEFVKSNQDHYPIKLLCKCLKLTRSLYYYHKEIRTNKYKEANIFLDTKILEIFKKSKSRYGAPKIKQKLKEDNICSSIKRITKRMKYLGLRSIVVKKFNHAGNKKVEDKNRPNLLNQKFTATEPRKKWVADITYVYTKQDGWTYLAIVLDLFDRQVIGHSYSKKMDSKLVETAFENAKTNRGLGEDLMLHTDLGSQYTSEDFENLLRDNNVRHSYSKKAFPWDNASMESFNAILKKEEVNVSSYKTFEETKFVLFEFIESWYNRERIHGSLGYLTPVDFYNAFNKCS